MSSCSNRRRVVGAALAKILLHPRQHGGQPAQGNFGNCSSIVGGQLGSITLAPIFPQHQNLYRPRLQALCARPMETSLSASEFRHLLPVHRVRQRPMASLRVIPDQERCVTSHDSQRIFDGGFEMQFCVHGQINAEQFSNVFEIGPCGINKYWGIDAFSRTQPDSVYAAVRHIYACHACGFKLDPAPASRFEEVHAQLLRAQPTCASDMQRGDRAFCQIGEMFANEFVADQQVRAIGESSKSFGVGGLVG